MTASQGQHGPWTVTEEPGNCSMCGARWETGGRVRHDPDAGGLVCVACGQDEDEVPGIVDQFLGGQEVASPQDRRP